MRLIVMIIFLVLLGILAAMNTNFLTYPHTLHLGFATYENMPMGLLLLAIMLIPMLVFYFWASISKLRAEADSAKLLRDMEALRTSLDSQESSRFQQLQAHLDRQFTEINNRALPGSSGSAAEVASLAAKLDAMKRDLDLQLDQMDDYLKRKLG